MGFYLPQSVFWKKKKQKQKNKKTTTTYNALLTQSGISVDKNDTTLFINKVLKWWKILNVKSHQIDKLRNDPIQAEIRSLNDTRLDFIIE